MIYFYLGEIRGPRSLIWGALRPAPCALALHLGFLLPCALFCGLDCLAPCALRLDLGALRPAPCILGEFPPMTGINANAVSVKGIRPRAEALGPLF